MTGIAGRPANDHCTCAEVAGENPECVQHGVKAIIQKLRDLALGKHSDVSVAWEAAEMLDSLWDHRPDLPHQILPAGGGAPL